MESFRAALLDAQASLSPVRKFYFSTSQRALCGHIIKLGGELHTLFSHMDEPKNIYALLQGRFLKYRPLAVCKKMIQLSSKRTTRERIDPDVMLHLYKTLVRVVDIASRVPKRE